MTKGLEVNGLREEVIEIKFERTITKHLNDLEEICTTCEGTGLRVDPGVFGISGYEDPKGKAFPFCRESLMFCQSCYGGVRKRCFYCNELIKRGYTVCDCDQARTVKAMQQNKREGERYEKAEKVPFAEALERFDQVYIEGYDRFIETKDLMEWIADRNLEFVEEEGEELNLSLLRIYGTKIVDISIDARDVISAATDELHEEAESRTMKHVKNLQEKIDEFLTEEVKSEARTYFIDYKCAVVLV
jgi:hypothetical protein